MDQYTVKLAPKSESKRFNVFKLHKDDNVSWSETKMRRESDNQPWQIKVGAGRNARRFKAIQEGGVSDNASYFVFYKSDTKSDTYEVCPVEEWYSISATQRYKTLTAEEAEQKFEQRHKMLNMFSVMHRKNGEPGEEGYSGSDDRGFKVTEMDDWDNSGEDDASGDDEDGSQDKKKTKKKKGTKKEENDEAPEQAVEESDEGDFEQREVDYMSDTSSESSFSDKSKADPDDVKGIAEEEALRDLLSTDDEEDPENPDQKGPKSKDRMAGVISDIKTGPDNKDSDDSSDSEDYDVDDDKIDSLFAKQSLPSQFAVKQEIKQEPAASTSSSSTSVKRKAPETSLTPAQPAKRICPPEPTAASSSSVSGYEKIVEDLIRKYLSRKPMSLKTLLKEIKSKFKRMDSQNAGLSKIDGDLLQTIASTIKRIGPDTQKINGTTYLSLKA